MADKSITKGLSGSQGVVVLMGVDVVVRVYEHEIVVEKR